MNILLNASKNETLVNSRLSSELKLFERVCWNSKLRMSVRI